jgi:hypothetical protein
VNRPLITKPRDTEEENTGAKVNKRKKKGLTEKDLDFEQMFDDDQDEDLIIEEDEEVEEDEENLSEDGRKMKELLKL